MVKTDVKTEVHVTEPWLLGRLTVRYFYTSFYVLRIWAAFVTNVGLNVFDIKVGVHSGHDAFDLNDKKKNSIVPICRSVPRPVVNNASNH